MRNIWMMAVVFTAGGVIGGCGSEPEFPNPLLDRVAADTPYLVASGKPIPEAVYERFKPVREAVSENAMGQMQGASKALANSDSRSARLMGALLTGINQAVASEGGLESIGVARDARYVIYGLGLLPAARLTLSDPAAFRAFFREILKEAGLTPAAQEISGAQVWKINLETFTVIAGLEGNMFSAALSRPAQEEEKLVKLFGDRGIAHSAADRGVVAALVDEYGFVPSTTGYLDLARVAELLLGTPAEAGALAAFGVTLPDFSNDCREAVLAYVKKAPRVVVGTEEISTERFAARGIWELEPALAAELTGWSVPVPGLGAQTHALVQIGYGLNLAAVSKSLREWFTAMASRDAACSAVAEVDWAALASKINPAGLYMAGNPKGLVLTLRQAALRSVEPVAFENLQATLVVLMENPRMVPAMIQAMVPAFKSLDIPADGTPVSLSETIAEFIARQAEEGSDQSPGKAASAMQYLKPMYIALTDKLLGLSVGAAGKEHLQEAMAAETVPHPPVLRFTMDAEAIYAKFARWLPKFAEKDKPENREMLIYQAETAKAYSELYERLDFRLGFTPDGVEFTSEVTLQ